MSCRMLGICPCLPIHYNKPEMDQVKIEKILRDFEWGHLIDLVPSYLDFFRFLKESGILYAIRGYQQTLQRRGENSSSMDPLAEGIKVIGGKPHILKEGSWVTWEELKETIYFDPKKREIFSKDNPQIEWNYFFNPLTNEIGLCPKTRYNQIRPIYQLSQKEKDDLGLQHGQCALQIFTSSNAYLSKISHVGLRLIDGNGRVYSLGFETPTREVKFSEQRIVGNYDAEITSLDYDEFTRFKERRVTTIPLTKDQFDLALEKELGYTQKPVRFNRIHQNCATHAINILKAAQQPTPTITCTLREGIWDLISDISYLGPTLNKIKSIALACLSVLQVIPVVNSLCNGLTFLSGKVLTVVANLVIFSLGASRGSKPNELAEQDSIDNEECLTYFSYLIKGKMDLFKEDIDQIHFPPRLVQWQLTTMSPHTKIHSYTGPALYL